MASRIQVQLPIFDIVQFFLERNRQKQMGGLLQEATDIATGFTPIVQPAQEVPFSPQVTAPGIPPQEDLTQFDIAKLLPHGGVPGRPFDLPAMKPSGLVALEKINEIGRELLDKARTPQELTAISKTIQDLRAYAEEKVKNAELVPVLMQQARMLGVPEQEVAQIEQIADIATQIEQLKRTIEPILSNRGTTLGKALGKAQAFENPAVRHYEEEKAKFEFTQKANLELLKRALKEGETDQKRLESSFKIYEDTVKNNMMQRQKAVDRMRVLEGELFGDGTTNVDLLQPFSQSVPIQTGALLGLLHFYDGDIDKASGSLGIELSLTDRAAIQKYYNDFTTSNRGFILEQLGELTKLEFDTNKYSNTIVDAASKSLTIAVRLGHIPDWTLDENNKIVNVNTGQPVSDEEFKLVAAARYGFLIEDKPKTDVLLNKLRKAAEQSAQEIGEKTGENLIKALMPKVSTAPSPEALLKSAMQTVGETVGGFTEIVKRVPTKQPTPEELKEKQAQITQRQKEFGLLTPEEAQRFKTLPKLTPEESTIPRATALAQKYASNPEWVNKLRNNPLQINRIVEELIKQKVLTREEIDLFVNTLRRLLFATPTTP